VGSSTISGAPSRFLSLPAAATFGRKSATAALITTRRDRRGCDHRLAHLLGRLDLDEVAADRRGQFDRGHQRDRRASGGSFGSDRVALLAGAAIGDHPDGVDRLARPTGGHHHRDAVEITRPQFTLDRCDDGGRIGESSGPDVAAGEATGSGSTTCTPRARQHLDVVDDARVLPHLGVHRRADHHRCPGGDERVGEQIGRQPHPVRREQPGGRRGDEDQIGALADPRVGIGVVGLSHSSVCTGSEASALSVVLPMKCSAPSVMIGTT
jgi:hypothetical protein